MNRFLETIGDYVFGFLNNVGPCLLYGMCFGLLCWLASPAVALVAACGAWLVEPILPFDIAFYVTMQIVGFGGLFILIASASAFALFIGSVLTIGAICRMLGLANEQ
jgi:hypothetical protein